MKKLFLVILFCLLGACAKKQVEIIPPPGLESENWQKMLDLSATASKTPWKTQFSLRFGTDGDSRRVTGIMWGNNENDIRMDIMAGIGAIIAMIEENGPQFTLFVPQQNKAYTHNGASPLFRIGVPVPFDLPKFAQLLSGNYTAIFGSSFTKIEKASQDNTTYMLADDSNASLTINKNGQPIIWQEIHKGWQMTMDYDKVENNLPKKITLEHSGGKRAILLVKERTANLAPFTSGQMKLALPSGISLLPLAQYIPK